MSKEYKNDALWMLGFTVAALGFLFLTSCHEREGMVELPTSAEYIDVMTIECDTGTIIIDKNTGVMYYERFNGGITPIYNADGSLKIWINAGAMNDEVLQL